MVAGAAISAASLAGLLESYGSGGATFVFSLFYLSIGLVAVLFFGYALVFLTIRLVSRIFGEGILLEIRPDGFVDRASAVGVGFVSWDEVRSMKFRSVVGQRFLVVKAEDGEALIGRLNPLKRAVVRLNR